jgi:hypothetical protein
MEPICIIEVFSMLHFNPEKVAKFSRIVFNALRLSKLKIVATLVSSAKPSALSVSHLDSASKHGLFSDLIASRIAGCVMFSLLHTVLGTCKWLKTLAISGQSSIFSKRICWPMLYSHGEGPLPWVRPRSKLKGGETVPSS